MTIFKKSAFFLAAISFCFEASPSESELTASDGVFIRVGAVMTGPHSPDKFVKDGNIHKATELLLWRIGNRPMALPPSSILVSLREELPYRMPDDFSYRRVFTIAPTDSELVKLREDKRERFFLVECDQATYGPFLRRSRHSLSELELSVPMEDVLFVDSGHGYLSLDHKGFRNVPDSSFGYSAELPLFRLETDQIPPLAVTNARLYLSSTSREPGRVDSAGVRRPVYAAGFF